MNDTASGRPWQLDNQEWLSRRYQQAGDRTIATELGCARETVRKARQRLGIQSLPDGRRRGRTASHQPTAIPLTITPPAGDVITQLTDRFHQEQTRGTPPTRETLIAACKHWLDAEKHRDPDATHDALLTIATAALLIQDHHTKLRNL